MNEKHPFVVCLCGPPGVGKTSFINRLVDEYGFKKAIAATTRNRRGDDDPSAYRYLTRKAFHELHLSGALMEADSYCGERYGTYGFSHEVYGNLNGMAGIVLDLTPHGCISISKYLPHTCVLALVPDDFSWLEKKLRQRNTNDSDEIEARMGDLKRLMEEIELLVPNRITISCSPETWEASFQLFVQAIKNNRALFLKA